MTVEEAGVERRGYPKPFPDTPSNVLDQFQMKGKVTVVNGAADGIGLAVAYAIAEAGGNVALWYNSNHAAVTRAEEIAKEFGVKTKAYQVAVENADAVRMNMDQVVDDFGKIDVFVANAGMAISKPILEQTLPEYDQQMSVNGQASLYGFSKIMLMCCSQWCCILRQIRRSSLQAPGFWKSHHHQLNVCTHRQRAY